MALLQATTQSGIVRGIPCGNPIFTVFKGIPFAAPPVGELRWKAPQPPIPWEGVKQADRFAPACPQEPYVNRDATEYPLLPLEESEDCLYLNIWTPALKPGENLPVAVFIHGGGYEAGFSYRPYCDGEGFAKRGVILVTVAYRVNVFGFLAHSELEAEDPHQSTGNYGTLDIIAAIQWAKKNIYCFGGDPDNITVFGQSAGGFAAQDMCATPLLKGCFQRVIFQSGGGLSRNGVLAAPYKEEAEALGEKFLTFCGFSHIEEARKAPSGYLVSRYTAFKKAIQEPYPFVPIVDGYVLPEKPEDYFLSGKHDDIDSMVGVTSDELRIFGAPAPSYEQIRQSAQKRFGDLADRYCQCIHADDPLLCQPYFEDPLGEDMLAADFAWCINQNRLGRKPAYQYYFTYIPTGADKAHHSAEHHYVFQTLLRSKRPYTGKDFDLSVELADFWTNFIKTGNPNGSGPAIWTPYTPESPRGLDIGEQRVMREIPKNPNVAFMADYSLHNLA